MGRFVHQDDIKILFSMKILFAIFLFIYEYFVFCLSCFCEDIIVCVNSLCPRGAWLWFWMCNFLKCIIVITFMNTSSAVANGAGCYWWEVNLGSGNGLVLSENKSLLRTWTHFDWDPWLHMLSLGHNELNYDIFVMSGLDINFFRRLSEAWCYQLKCQFPCTLLFENGGQPVCEFKGHIRLDLTSGQPLNSLWPRDAIWRQRSESTLAQVMACCLTAPSHYLNQCWLIITKVQWHSSDGSS